MLPRTSHWRHLLSSIGIVLGLLSPLLFPHSEATITDWQIIHAQKAPINTDILVIELERKGPVACGLQDWNHHVLVDMITSLINAKASTIASLIPLRGPASPQCGGILGDVKLLEIIHHDNIIIPSGSTSLFTQSARAVGHTDLGLDIEGVLRQVPAPTREDSIPLLPWGRIVAHMHQDQTLLDTGAYPNTGTPPRLLRWFEETYTTFSDTQLWIILQGSSIQTLQTLVQDKIVVLLPKNDSPFLIHTPFGNKIKNSYAHLQILQNVLSGNGSRAIGTAFLVILVCLFGEGSTRIMLGNPLRMGFLAITAMSMLYGILVWGMLTTTGMLLPILTPLVTICCTTGLAGAWRIWAQQSHTKYLMTNMEKDIVHLKHQLIGKEQRMADLSRQLQNPAPLSTSPTSLHSEVQETAQRIQKEWQDAQIEVKHLRATILKLESQLPLLPQTKSQHGQDFPDNLDTKTSDLQQQCYANGIVTRDPHLLNMFANLQKAAKTVSPILLTGETGTGKEIFAKAVHTLSSYAGGPLIAVNVAAIRPELFESEFFGHARGAYTGAIGAKGFVDAASQGTLFLDEIGEIPWHIQAKLLRLFEDGTYYRVGETRSRTANLRIVAATNRDLWHETQEGNFRADLYYRLTTFSFTLPPLRQRIPEDRQLLAQFFIQEIAKELGKEEMLLSQGAMEAIGARSWPGNIRELKHTLTQAATLTDDGLLTEDSLRLKPQLLNQHPPEESGNRVINQQFIQSTDCIANCDDDTLLAILRENRFDMQSTAKTLQWDRSTVTQRLKGLSFQALVRHHGNIDAAAQELAVVNSITPRVRNKLRDYYNNLILVSQYPATIEEAMIDCRRRMKNLPDRYFTAVETLLRWSLTSKSRPQNPVP